MRRSLFITLPVAGLAAATALTACGEGGDSAAGSQDGGNGGLDVVAAFYPLAFAAERVGGEHVTVTDLVPAGVEPHDFELSPGALAAIEQADYVVYFDGFMPEIDAAIDEYAADKALDIGTVVDLIAVDAEAIEPDDDHDDEDDHGHDHGHDDDHADDDHADEDDHGHDHGDELDGLDPHVWLDPLRYGVIGQAIADGFANLDAGNADDYAAAAAEFTADLNDLDAAFTDGLATRTSDDIVVSHAAFGYLAERYGLHQVAISGLSPDQEPNPGRMAAIARYVEEHGVTTIFFETLASSEVAETIAAETGAQTAVLNPLEGLTADQEGEDYFSIMGQNLAALQAALGAE